MNRSIFITLILLLPLLGPGALAQDNQLEMRVLEWPDGTRYEGGVLNGKKEGPGTIYWPDGTRFEGIFSNDLREGSGTLIFPDGTVFTGVFSEDRLLVAEETEPVETEEQSDSTVAPEPAVEEIAEAEPVPDNPAPIIPEPSQAQVELSSQTSTSTEDAVPQATPETEIMDTEPDEPMEEQGGQEELAVSENLSEPVGTAVDFPEDVSESVEGGADIPEFTAENEMDDNAGADEVELIAETEVSMGPAEEDILEATTSEQITSNDATPADQEASVESMESMESIESMEGMDEEPLPEAEEPLPALAVVEEIQTSEEAEQEQSPVYTYELEDEVVSVIDAWARAWSSQNPDLYLSFYSDDFEVPAGMSRLAWENQRRNRIRGPAFIQVDVGYEQFELVEDDVIEVYLRQGYTSDNYSDFTNKMMRLERKDDIWKIVLEQTL